MKSFNNLMIIFTIKTYRILGTKFSITKSSYSSPSFIGSIFDVSKTAFRLVFFVDAWKCSAVRFLNSSIPSSISAHSKINLRPYKCVLGQSESNAFYNKNKKINSFFLKYSFKCNLRMTNLCISFVVIINKTKSTMCFFAQSHFLWQSNRFQFTKSPMERKQNIIHQFCRANFLRSVAGTWYKLLFEYIGVLRIVS